MQIASVLWPGICRADVRALNSVSSTGRGRGVTQASEAVPRALRSPVWVQTGMKSLAPWPGRPTLKIVEAAQKQVRRRNKIRRARWNSSRRKGLLGVRSGRRI